MDFTASVEIKQAAPSDDATKPVSENVSKKQGRSRLIDELSAAGIAYCKPTLSTARGKQNLFYAFRAIRIIEYQQQQESFEWLVSTRDKIWAGAGKYRWTILAELGRIDDPDDLIEWAGILCDRQPTVRETQAMIRRWRGVQRKKPQHVDLTVALARVHVPHEIRESHLDERPVHVIRVAAHVSIDHEGAA